MEEYSFNFMPIYIGKIKKLMQKELNEKLKKHDLSSFHVMYIMVLYKNAEGLTLKELSSLVEVDKANTTRAINDLLNKDYIYRTEEMRKYKIKLTQKGKNIAKEVEKGMCSIHQKAFENFSEDEKKELIRLVIKFFNNITKEEK